MKDDPKVGDWTEVYDRRRVITEANRLIDDVVVRIHNKRLSVYRELSQFELRLLLRSPIHTGTSIFIERLMRISYQEQTGRHVRYPAVQYQLPYFRSIYEAILTYYHDFVINYGLLNLIRDVIGKRAHDIPDNGAVFPRPQDALLNSGSLNLKKLLKNGLKRANKLYVKASKPEIIGEYSKWMREILPLGNMLHFGPWDTSDRTDKRIRDEIRRCCKEAFLRAIRFLLVTLRSEQEAILSDVYARFVDHILPVSLVEGFKRRYWYYDRLLSNWPIKQVHSFTGYYWNEDLKIFALLAKRRKAVLVSHAHGIGNLQSSDRAIYNDFSFVDYHFTWGKNCGDWRKGTHRIDNLQVISLGSTYLSTIKKWKKNNINSECITMLYASAPLMNFMAELDEITTEAHYQHRLNVLSYLKELSKRFPKLKILYKPFVGTFLNDPIKDVLAEEMRTGKIELVDGSPTTFFDRVDVVFWDSVSTGFAESIQSGVPTLAFISEYECKEAFLRVQELERELIDCGVIFLNTYSGIKSFQKVVNDLEGFVRERTAPIQRFREELAFPTSRNELVKGLQAILVN